MNDLALLGLIVQLARDPRVRLEELEQCIASSRWLATEVVRVADSPLFGQEGRIHSLTRALLILGAEQVCAIAAMIELRRAGGERWTHGLEIAVCSQLVSRQLGLGLESEAFLAGLLHELGGAPPEPVRPLAALLSAAHAILADTRTDALDDLDVYPDDAAAVRAELGERMKLLSAIV